MSSLTRMLSVLDLFSRAHTALTAEQIARQLSLSRTTCYRYVAELMNAGLLVCNAGVYGLGPRIIQLDHRIREADPVINHGAPILAGLAAQTGAMGLLSSIYNDQIINIHQAGGEGLASLRYSRGMAVPTFRSCSSKVILANLKPARLRRIWSAHQTEPDVLALGEGWEGFNARMSAIRFSGYWVSHQEIDPDAVGVAAPIFFAGGEVAGSMTLIFQAEHFAGDREAEIGQWVLGAAQRVSDALQVQTAAG